VGLVNPPGSGFAGEGSPVEGGVMMVGVFIYVCLQRDLSTPKKLAIYELGHCEQRHIARPFLFLHLVGKF
jgi:hypothetical protein